MTLDIFFQAEGKYWQIDQKFVPEDPRNTSLTHTIKEFMDRYRAGTWDDPFYFTRRDVSKKQDVKLEKGVNFLYLLKPPIAKGFNVVYRVRPKNRKTSNFAVIGLMRF
jgi:hypothetical protein